MTNKQKKLCKFPRTRGSYGDGSARPERTPRERAFQNCRVRDNVYHDVFEDTERWINLFARDRVRHKYPYDGINPATALNCVKSHSGYECKVQYRKESVASYTMI